MRKGIPVGQEMISIVTRDTTLHLSTDSSKIRHQWVQGLRFVTWLVRHQDGKMEEFYYWYSRRGDVRQLIRVSTINLKCEASLVDEDEETAGPEKECEVVEGDADDDQHEKLESKMKPAKKAIPAPFFASAPEPLVNKRQSHVRANSVPNSSQYNARASYEELTAPNLRVFFRPMRILLESAMFN